MVENGADRKRLFPAVKPQHSEVGVALWVKSEDHPLNIHDDNVATASNKTNRFQQKRFSVALKPSADVW